MQNRIFPFQKDTLTGLGVRPSSGSAKKMMVLLHGYQGDAESNMDFALKLSAARPEAVVLVPNGIQSIAPANDPHHRQWWDLDETSFDGRFCSFMPCYAPIEQQNLIRETVRKTHQTTLLLNRFILNRLKEYDLRLSDCFVVGISQGGITAFEMTLFCNDLHRDRHGTFLGGLISIGSGIIGADRLRSLPEELPPIPVLLARGEHDEIFPKTVDYFSYSVLKEHHLPVFLTQADSAHFGLEHRVCDAVCRFISDHC